MLGWKKIETRTHSKFNCLVGKRIGIHAGLNFDTSNAASENPYLSPRQIQDTMPIKVPRGMLLGTAYVWNTGPLNSTHSEDALIDCDGVQRYGLFLRDVIVFDTPIPMRGAQGIWSTQLSI